MKTTIDKIAVAALFLGLTAVTISIPVTGIFTIPVGAFAAWWLFFRTVEEGPRI
ncbi:hypothetical protein HTZ84_05285 [Haloterrigena sp. SYSU A558-1]|uniref:Uncharacterized protein n=1 Tax=Haloterrigena gelatinilytica TaxID=2741724 RepID=A0ABX2L636_9EURY|nr:hypothetical protein [Haloterrigena gelatinilytica]NUC71727.1 hypothetical protein [Haloterrigena gelatinilytica]